jgi:hypothetical protein
MIDLPPRENFVPPQKVVSFGAALAGGAGLETQAREKKLSPNLGFVPLLRDYGGVNVGVRWPEAHRRVRG